MKDLNKTMKKNERVNKIRRILNFSFKFGKYDIYWYVLPISPILIACEKISNYYYKSLTWNEEKANKIIESMLSYILEFDKENEIYYLGINNSANILTRKTPLLYRNWVKKFKSNLRTYLLEEYQIDGYTKTVEKDYEEIYINFQKNT